MAKRTVLALIALVGLVSGCDTLHHHMFSSADIVMSPRYIPQIRPVPELGAGRRINLIVIDDGPEKLLGGIAEGWGDRRILFAKPRGAVVEEVFRQALAEWCWRVSTDAEYTCRVNLVEAKVSSVGLSGDSRARVTVNVTILRGQQALRTKTIVGTGWEESAIDHWENCFSEAASRAALTALADKDLFGLVTPADP